MIYFLVFILLLAADQASKYYISHNFELYKSVSIIDNFFYLTYVRNQGAAFGILQNAQFLFIAVTSIIMIVLMVYFIITPRENKLLRTSLLLIMAGGIGNLIDRIRFGYVVDFFDVQFWPVFNLADSLVVIGSILLGYFILFKYK